MKKPALTEAVLQKLVSICANDIPDLANVLIRPGAKGSVVLFNKYVMHRKNKTVLVTTETATHEFVNARYAVSWCVAHNARELNTACAILSAQERLLDLLETRAKLTDIMATLTDKTAVSAKLSEVDHRIASTLSIIDKYVIVTRYWQLKGFYNETARPITAKNRKQARKAC